jgi:glycosyltransferase involved in cell wall biosynthesis
MRQSISVVIPTFNSQESIKLILGYLKEALRAADTNSQIIIIDKSDDLTKEWILDSISSFKQGTIELHRQQGNGRFLARDEGLRFVKNETVLLIDSRVSIDRNSLQYVLNFF